MRVDYDRLRTDLAGKENGTPGVVHCTWTDLAHEVLDLNNERWRLREEVEHLAAQLRREMQKEVVDGNCHTASAINAIHWRLQHLLDGDNE